MEDLCVEHCICTNGFLCRQLIVFHYIGENIFSADNYIVEQQPDSTINLSFLSTCFVVLSIKIRILSRNASRIVAENTIHFNLVIP